MRPFHKALIAISLCFSAIASSAAEEPAGNSGAPVISSMDLEPPLSSVGTANPAADTRLLQETQWLAPQSKERPVNPWNGLYFGSSIVFAKPNLKESFQANIFQPATGTMTLVPYSTDYRTTPRFWLGFGAPEGLGVQARYWEFDQSFDPFSSVATFTAFPGAQTATIILPTAILATIPGSVLSVQSGMELRTFDLEGTMRYELQRTQVLLGGGLRYALIQQDYRAQVLAGGVPISTLTWDRKLEGVGPLIGAQLRRPLGGSGFALVGGGRAALIFGSKDIHRNVVNALPQPPSNPTVNFDNADELLANVEMDFGLEWSRRFNFGDLFARATYEGQLWTDSGGSALGYMGVEGFGLSLGVTH